MQMGGEEHASSLFRMEFKISGSEQLYTLSVFIRINLLKIYFYNLIKNISFGDLLNWSRGTKFTPGHFISFPCSSNLLMLTDQK